MRRTLLCLLALAALPFAGPPAGAQPAPPAWAQDAVWYQLFPERFRNGDPDNDPTWASLDYPPPAAERAWTVSEWTADWYARQPWERALGPDFYEHGVFARRYGGDLQGVLDRLGYLDSLGVNAIYFNPVFYAPSLHKYDGAAFHHIDPYFGPDPAGDLAQMDRETADPASWGWTAADSLFLRVIEEAHARGIRVVIDGVFNHTGPRFFAFEHLRRHGQASPYRDWYVVSRWDDPATPAANEFDWEGWWGFKGLPIFADATGGGDLAAGPKAYVMAITRRWMDPDGDGDPADGIDGWRLDVSEEVPTAFWRDWHGLVRALNPQALTVAEAWGDARAFLEAAGFSSVMNYHGFGIPLHDFLADGRMTASQFVRALDERAAAYPAASAHALMNLTASHDTDRLPSMLANADTNNYDRHNGARYNPAYALRAPNERERDLQRIAAVLQATGIGAPMLYYGDEAGMWGGDDPDDRKPMVWPDLAYQPERADPRGRRRAPDTVAFDHGLFAFYRDALALRHRYPALRRGGFEPLASNDGARTFAYARRLNGDEIVVMVNASDEPQALVLPGADVATPLVPIFASRGDVADIPSLVITLYEEGPAAYRHPIPARTAVVLRWAQGEDVRPRGLNE